MVELDNMIEKIMDFGKNEYFYANGRFKCSFWKWQATGKEAFSDWNRDTNSPTLFREAMLNVIDEQDNHKQLLGLMVVQKSSRASNNKYFASIFIKPVNSNGSWQSMHTVTSLIG